jgi:protoporphyrinogen/coproporphyrinogen III oxidase
MKKIVTQVLVIGAGITGLTAAYELKKRGIDFRVIDKSSDTGGVISTHEENGFIYETGPNTGVLSQPDGAELIQELDGLCEIEIANAAAKKRWIWKSGSWHALPAGLKAAIDTPLFTLKDKFRILLEPFRPKGNNPDETLAHLVQRRMGKSFLDYAVDPFILGIYSGDPSYLVTRYAMPKLYNLEQNYGSFIGGAVRKGFQKKDERTKLATGDVFSIKGGLSNLIRALELKIGTDSILLNFNGAVVVPEIEGLRKFNPSMESGFNTKGYIKGEEVEINSRQVIATVGSHELPLLLPFMSKSEASAVNNLIYARVLQATIGFNKWEGVPLDAFGGLVPFKEQRDVLGVLFLSSFLSERAPNGGALLSVFMGGVRRPELADLKDDEVIAILAKELKDMTGLKQFNPDLLKITHYSHAIPQYGLSTGERLETVELLQKKYPGLLIGGNLRNGIGMSDRIKQGRELAGLIT